MFFSHLCRCFWTTFSDWQRIFSCLTASVIRFSRIGRFLGSHSLSSQQVKSIHLLNGIWFLLLRALPGHASPSSAHTGCADQLKCFSLPMSLDQSPGIFFSWNPYHSFFFPLGSSSYYQVLQLQSSKFCQQMNTFFFFRSFRTRCHKLGEQKSALFKNKFFRNTAISWCQL